LKGQAQYVGLAVVTLVVVTTILGTSFRDIVNFEERIYLNTMDLPAERVGTAVYSMDAVERGEVELEMPVEYGIESRRGSIYLNYSMETVVGETKSSEIKIHDPKNVVVEFDVEEGVSDTFCINKTSQDLKVSAGGC